MFCRITRNLGQISRGLYSIKPLSPDRLQSFVNRIKSDISEWKAQLPPFLGAISPSSLIQPFRRQATALRLAYSHAIIHATRPFLLGTIGGNSESSDITNEQISECISSARHVLETVDAIAGDGPLFHAFWWTHYVTFCALAVVYIWEIQRHLSDITLFDQEYHRQLFELAEKCQTHLAEATASNSPGRRYSIILKELQSEAKQTVARTALHSLSLTPHNGTSILEYDSTPAEDQEPGLRRQESQSAPAAMEMENGVGMHHFWDDWQTTDWLEIDSLVSSKKPSCQNLERTPADVCAHIRHSINFLYSDQLQVRGSQIFLIHSDRMSTHDPHLVRCNNIPLITTCSIPGRINRHPVRAYSFLALPRWGTWGRLL